MSTLKLKGSTSGYVELTAPATAGNNTITLPTTAGTVAVVNSSGNLLVNTTTSTGTASQPFQVSGGGYFSGNLGVGITNPTAKLELYNASGSAAWRFRIGTNVSDGAGFYQRANGDFEMVLRDASNNNNYVVGSSGNLSLRPTSNVLINTETPTGTASQPFQVSGGGYFSGSVGIGTTRPTSTFQVVGGDSDFEGVIETVGTATTYMVGNGMVLEMDVRRATVYTYTMPTGANIGIVSFKNMPAQTGSATGSTVTLLVTQNAAGTGNTTAATGIGTNCTVVGYENGASVAGISTRGLVGSAVTTTLSTTGGDIDFVSFFINYTGGTNTAASSYKVYVTKNGGFRRGNVGV